MMKKKLWSEITDYFWLRAEAAEVNGDHEYAYILRAFYFDMKDRIEAEIGSEL